MTSETVPTTSAPASASVAFAPALRVLEDAIAAGAFPGCAFGVFAGGQRIWDGCLGRFTYDESSPAVEADTVFDVASLTKVVATTAAAMLLYQQRRLDLETPVADLLPGFVIGRESGTFARHVKVRHLLAHNAGLPGYVEFFRTHDTAAGLLRACLELPIEVPPGSRAEYSDPGFILLGKALEVIIREPLDQWLQREVFGPLGMLSTRYRPRRSSQFTIPPTEEDMALRHRLIQGEVQDENAYILGGVAGHAGLFSNVPDLLRFAQEILSAARHIECGPSQLFEAATINRFAERQEPQGSSRALGWDTPSENSSAGHHFSPRSIGHLGYSGCSIWIDLSEGIAVVLLTNRTWPDRKSQLIREVRPAFHDAVRKAL